MSQINDAIRLATGGGSINDGLSDWYSRNASQSIQDAERSWLLQRPYSVSGSNQDMWYQFLRADGYTGALSDMLREYWDAPSRVIPTFTGTQYGTLDTPITFTGDFEVEVPVATTTNDTSWHIVFGESVTGTYVGAANLVDRLGLSVDGFTNNAVIPVTVDPFDGKVHTWKLTRVGTTITLYIDEILQISGAGLGGNVTINEIGSYIGGSLNWIGQILSTKFTDNSTGEVINYVFDSGSDLYQMARGEGLGGDIGYEITVPALSSVNMPDIMVAGDYYFLEASPHPDLRYTKDGGGWYSFNTDVVFKQTTSTTMSFYNSNASPITFTPVLRKLPTNTCLLTNFTSANWSRYTLQRNITHDAGTIAEAWLGDNLVVNGGFDDGISGWSIDAGGTISHESQALRMDSPSGAWRDVSAGSILSPNTPYIASIEIKDITNLIRFVAGNTPGVLMNSALSYKEVITCGSATTFEVRAESTSVNVNALIDNVSAQHLLEIA